MWLQRRRSLLTCSTVSIDARVGAKRAPELADVRTIPGVLNTFQTPSSRSASGLARERRPRPPLPRVATVVRGRHGAVERASRGARGEGRGRASPRRFAARRPPPRRRRFGRRAVGRVVRRNATACTRDSAGLARSRVRRQIFRRERRERRNRRLGVSNALSERISETFLGRCWRLAFNFREVVLRRMRRDVCRRGAGRDNDKTRLPSARLPSVTVRSVGSGGRTGGPATNA